MLKIQFNAQIIKLSVESNFSILILISMGRVESKTRPLDLGREVNKISYGIL